MLLVHYIKYMLSILDFLTVSHLKSMIYLYHGSEKCCETSHLRTTNLAICIPAEIHSAIQMKPYRAAII